MDFKEKSIAPADREDRLVDARQEKEAEMRSTVRQMVDLAFRYKGNLEEDAQKHILKDGPEGTLIPGLLHRLAHLRDELLDMVTPPEEEDNEEKEKWASRRNRVDFDDELGAAIRQMLDTALDGPWAKVARDLYGENLNAEENFLYLKRFVVT